LQTVCPSSAISHDFGGVNRGCPASATACLRNAGLPDFPSCHTRRFTLPFSSISSSMTSSAPAAPAPGGHRFNTGGGRTERVRNCCAVSAACTLYAERADKTKIEKYFFINKHLELFSIQM